VDLDHPEITLHVEVLPRDIYFSLGREAGPGGLPVGVSGSVVALLSGGKTSRLYQSLVRDKQLVLSADADHSLLSKDPALFYLSADPLPGKEVPDVEKALDQEIERLQQTLVDEGELEKVQNQLESSFVFAQDSLFSQAMLLAQHEI
jgi:zinc protease